MRRVSLSLALTLFAFTLFAQQEAPPAPRLFFVHEEIAKPSMIAEYEKGSKEFGALMRGANIAFHYDAISSDDFRYYYLIPLKSFADVDRMMHMFMVEAPQKIGVQKFTEFMQRAGNTMESTTEWIVVQRNDISYMPAKPRLKMEEATWGRYDYYYLKPGMETMVDQISNEWKAAFAAANLPDGFTIYQAVIGADLPLVVVETRGKDPADIAVNDAKNMAALGEKGQALQAKTMATVRKFESRYGRVRPDLSNPAPRQATKQ